MGDTVIYIYISLLDYYTPDLYIPDCHISTTVITVITGFYSVLTVVYSTGMTEHYLTKDPIDGPYHVYPD